MLHKDTKKINNSKEITKKKCMEGGRQKHTGSGRHLPAERKVGNFPQTCRSILFS